MPNTSATSPSWPEGIGHIPSEAVGRAAAGDVRARKLYFRSLAAFRSNILDAADLGPGVREALLGFLRAVDAVAPTSDQLDAVAGASAPARLSERRAVELSGNGLGLR